MSSELVNIKQAWDDAVNNHLSSRGFQEVDCGYERKQTIQQPGRTVSINGQVFQQPGNIIEVRQIITNLGDGWLADMDESNKKEFTQYKFEIYQGDNLVTQYEENFYWDEPNYFINVFNQVFK